jgi:hypothetical protein
MSTDMHMKRHVTAAVLAVTFLQAVVALQLVLAPGQARAQPRDAPRPSTWLALPGQDSLSTQMEVPSMGVTSTGVPSIRAVQAGSLGLPPGPAARQGQFRLAPLRSDWSPRRAPLSPARPEDLSAAQNLLWGTVGLTLTAFFESNPPPHQSAWSRRATWSRHGPGRTVPSPRPRGLLPPPGHRDRDPVRRRSMEALVEGLFNIGSYTELK